MSKNTPKDNTVITSDKYISESGLQGGKILAEKLVLVCFAIGIPLFSIGLFLLLYFIFISGFPENWPMALYIFNPPSLALIIGLILIIGGYFAHKDKNPKKVDL